MELKPQRDILPSSGFSSFNRTAYGIETSVQVRRGGRLRAFNRTAYGIETTFMAVVTFSMGITFNRTAYGIETRIRC